MTSCLLYESLKLVAPFQTSVKKKYAVLTRSQEHRHKGEQECATVVILEAGRGRNTHLGTHHSQNVDTWLNA